MTNHDSTQENRSAEGAQPLEEPAEDNDPLLQAQSGKGYGEDEGERGESLDGE